MDILDILVKHRAEFLYGIKITLLLSVYIWIIGIALGTILGTASNRWKRIVGLPTRFLSFILSGIPVLVFLFWLHYPAQYLFKIVVNPFITTVVALSIVNAFLIADLMRSVLEDFPKQYLEAAYVSGFGRLETLRHIQLPIIWRQVMPNLLTIQIVMLQSTLFASLISVDEVFRIAQRINSEIYKPVEVYSALGIIFLIICLPMHGLALWFRAKYTRDISEK
ncbi:MAG: ABC transporter permease subunit [Hellea sp.]